MTDISQLPVGTRAIYTDRNGTATTGTVVGRLSRGFLEGDVDLDEHMRKMLLEIERVKIRFVGQIGIPPETLSVSCDPSAITLPDD